MKIETHSMLLGGSGRHIKAGLVKGRNWLKSQGFEPCQNTLYYRRGNEYAHFNKNMSVWILEDSI